MIANLKMAIHETALEWLIYGGTSSDFMENYIKIYEYIRLYEKMEKINNEDNMTQEPTRYRR